MTDVVAGETPEVAPPLQPEAAAELEAAPPPAPEAAPLAEAPAEPVLPEIEYPIGPLRQAVLDHLLDSAEAGPQSVSQILAAMPPGTTRGNVESAVKREYDQGRITRTSPGRYTLAPLQPPATPPEQPKVRDDGHTAEEWLAALEAYFVNAANWKPEEFGPPPNALDNIIPLEIKTRFNDRIRKRAARRKEAEEAAAKRTAADRELRDALIAACRGNVVVSSKLDDVSAMRSALEIVDLDIIVLAVRAVADLIVPRPPPLREWREPRLLEAIARHYCRHLTRRLIAEWSKAGTASARSHPVDIEPDDDIDRGRHDHEHEPAGPHTLFAPSGPEKAIDAPETLAAVPVPPKTENVPAVPPSNVDAPSGGDATGP